MPSTNPLTKKMKLCRDCGASMENEHPAAKSCDRCRHPEKYEEAPPAPVALGEVAEGEAPEDLPILESMSVSPPPPPSPVATPFFLRQGDTVSLNLKQRKFLRIPKSDFALTPRKWCGEIPGDMDQVQMRMFRVMLEAGDIVKGKVYTGIGKDETTLTKAAKLLKLGTVEFRTAIGLIVQQTGLIGGYKPHEIFRYLMRHEDDNDHRRLVLNFLQNAMDHVGAGPIKATPVVNRTIEEVTERKF